MLETEGFKERLKELREIIATLDDAINVDGLTARKKELELDMNEPGYWDNIERAQNCNKELKGIDTKLASMKSLHSRADDLDLLIDMAEEENDRSLIPEIEEEISSAQADAEKMHLQTLLSGEYDANNAILSLHAGAGGTEAMDWTSMLYRMYTNWCTNKGFKMVLLDYLPGDEAGIKSVTFRVEGENAYGYLKGEKGVHRLVRISPFDSAARRHTSFASLDVMPELDLSVTVKIRPEDIRVDTYHASGAGGQHINKTSSAIRITHYETGIVVQCQNERSQIQNRETAMKMLYAKLMEVEELKKQNLINDVKGELKNIEWGSQIRSYVFCPYTMVKDHRTEAETGNVDAVMDGDLDLFINAYLTSLKSGTK